VAERATSAEPLTVARLTQAFRAASLAAEFAKPGDDGGTANFDSAFLYAKRGLTGAKVQEAAKEAGVSVRRRDSRWWKGWFVEVGAGQGAMNTRMAEAACKALQEAGLEASVYYQID
jgi:hypothetical protein